MKLKKLLTIRILSMLCFFICISCSSDSNDDSSSSSSSSASENVDSETLSNFNSVCGVVENGESISVPTNAELVSVEVIGSDAAIITRQEGAEVGNKQLIQFHAVSSIGINDFRRLHGIDVLKKKLVGGAYFVPAGRDCEVVFEGGGEGILGQLYSLNGENINELMLAQGSVMPSSNICGGESLSLCYNQIPLTVRPPSDIELDLQDVNLSSQCGAVYRGELRNPITSAELVKIDPISVTEVVITRLLGLEVGNPQLVKLHGLSAEGLTETAKSRGLNYLRTAASPEAYLVVESLDCEIQVEGGGLGVTGQLYAKDGTSLNEAMLRSGYAKVSVDTCGGDLISTCYEEIVSSAPVIEDPVIAPPSNNGGGDEFVGGDENIISNFLWKPVSESNGNLVVLVNPLNVRIVVEGSITETLVDRGPSNGRGTTARGNRSGCSYGNNVVVTFYNSSGELIPVAGGGTSVTVARGCDRYEFRR